MKYVTTTRVNDQQVDELGHLNHVYALQLLEAARDDWYAQAGLWEGRDWSGDENLATLVLNVNINYRQECFLGEALQVVTEPRDRGNKSFTLSQQILRPDGTIAIDGSVTSLVMDMEQRRTLLVPDCLARYLLPRDPD